MVLYKIGFCGNRYNRSLRGVKVTCSNIENSQVPCWRGKFSRGCCCLDRSQGCFIQWYCCSQEAGSAQQRWMGLERLTHKMDQLGCGQRGSTHQPCSEHRQATDGARRVQQTSGLRTGAIDPNLVPLTLHR